MQNQLLPSPLSYVRIPQRIALSDSWCWHLVRITTWRTSSFCGPLSPKSLWSVSEWDEINAPDCAETMSEHWVACLWQRPAQPFSFIDHGACPWQPIVMLFEKMCHFNVFLFPGILNKFRWNLSKRRLSLTAQSKPRLVSLWKAVWQKALWTASCVAKTRLCSKTCHWRPFWICIASVCAYVKSTMQVDFKHQGELKLPPNNPKKGNVSL